MSDTDKNKNGHILEMQHMQIQDTKLSAEDAHSYTYNEALEYIGHGKFHTLLLFIVGGCLMSVVNESLNMGFIISAAQCDLNLTYSDKGILNGSAFLGVVLSSHFWGFLSDTWGRRKVLLTASFMAFIFSIISSFSVHVWMLIVTRFLVGFFISGNAASSYAYLAEFHSDKSRAKAISLAAMFMAFGMTYLPALAWVIIPLDSTVNLTIPLLNMRYSLWRVYIVLCSILDAVIAVGLYYMPESGKFSLTNGRKEETLETLQKMYKWNTGQSEESFPVKSIKLDAMDTTFADEIKTKSNVGLKYVWNQTVPLFKYPLIINTFRSSFLMFGLFASSSGLFVWIPDILNNYINTKSDGMTICEVISMMGQSQNKTKPGPEECHVDVDDTIFMITLLMGVIFILCYLVNGLVINYFGKKLLLNSWYIFCGVCGVCSAWTVNFHLTLTLLVGFLAAGVCGSIVGAISVDLFPTKYRAMALCLILMIGRFGAMIGSNTIAILLSYNCVLIFYVFGGLLILCALVGATLPGK